MKRKMFRIHWHDTKNNTTGQGEALSKSEAEQALTELNKAPSDTHYWIEEEDDKK